ADIIDLGMIPGESWKDIGSSVRKLRCEGFRLSIDSFDRFEVESAVGEGAELVLSCNSTNREWAANVSAEWVVLPDEPKDIGTWDETISRLKSRDRSYRLDPILEPIGFGFAQSLQRYFETRKRYPDAEMLMGVGNLTELTEVDSAGVNFLLATICEELHIGSVLTTEVINWGRSAVRELDIARRLVRHSLTKFVLPKHLGGKLVLLRDPKLNQLGDEGIGHLAKQITDPNFRIFAERGEIHLINRDGYWHGDDPYEVFDRIVADVGKLTSEHAFYLGYELCKAKTALTLGKRYTQDESLRWGFLTVDETSAIERRKNRSQSSPE
ncbi:MAG: dihydropteroate synthase, partial [Planctomycetes bacterium]|nr:dihydropteroate synthase [Planctomycetota bacterium]